MKVAGKVMGIHTEEEYACVKLRMEGTQAEALVKWAGSHPGVHLEVHLCPPDCGKLAKEGLLHATKVRLLKAEFKEAWMDNLMDVAVARDEGKADELRRIRERAEKREAEKRGEQRAPVSPNVVRSSSNSKSGRGAKKKKKKRSKKARKRDRKILGTKDLSAVFSTTALDPTPGVRKKVRKRAKKAARKKTRRGASSEASSEETSTDSQGTVEDPGHLFGEEVKVKVVPKQFPGALTLNTLEMIQGALVSQTGQPWDIDRSSLPPVFSQHWRLNLSGRMSGPMNREAQTLCFLQDLLLQGKVATCCDTITQRLKSLEQVAQGSHYTVAQRQELVPLDVAVMSTPMETLEASRLQREEAKAKSASARPWVRTQEWESDAPKERKEKASRRIRKAKGRPRATEENNPGRTGTRRRSKSGTRQGVKGLRDWCKLYSWHGWGKPERAVLWPPSHAG